MLLVFLSSILVLMQHSVAATALNCAVDLAQVDLRHNETALCDVGCESCNFSLTTDVPFYYGHKSGVIKCLDSVPCQLYTDVSVDFAMNGVQIKAELASSLSIFSKGSGFCTWDWASIYAPINGGNFRFESSSNAPVQDTYFYADNAGMVDLIFENGGYEHSMGDMVVFAVNALSLLVEVRAAATYADYDDLNDVKIYCPDNGNCLWKSQGTYDADYRPVLLIADRGTPKGVRLQCKNEEHSCEGIQVKCNNKQNRCKMTYTGDHWYCEGKCNTANDTMEG